MQLADLHKEEGSAGLESGDIKTWERPMDCWLLVGYLPLIGNKRAISHAHAPLFLVCVYGCVCLRWVCSCGVCVGVSA